MVRFAALPVGKRNGGESGRLDERGFFCVERSGAELFFGNEDVFPYFVERHGKYVGALPSDRGKPGALLGVLFALQFMRSVEHYFFLLLFFAPGIPGVL